MLKACESLLKEFELLEVMRGLRDGSGSSLLSKGTESSSSAVRQSLVELGRVWQASLCEITLRFRQSGEPIDNGGRLLTFLFLRICTV